MLLFKLGIFRILNITMCEYTSYMWSLGHFAGKLNKIVTVFRYDKGGDSMFLSLSLWDKKVIEFFKCIYLLFKKQIKGRDAGAATGWR